VTRSLRAAAVAAVVVAAGVAAWMMWKPFETEVFEPPPPTGVARRDVDLPAPLPANPTDVVPPAAPPAGPPPAPGSVPPVPPPMPPPARPVFFVGERALYEVTWLGLGAGLPAGTAEFVVTDGGAPGRYRFELLAVTANWVSTFFNARDRFWTETTPDLFPLVHGQDLREGRRHVERQARFERDAHLVRIGQGTADNAAAGVSRALSPDARDPIGAMYYVRTLAWDRDVERRLLVSDLGMDLAVELRAGQVERVRAEGREQEARPLTIRMTYVTEHYKTPKATVWLSTDARRIPLTADVESDVGVFRMALVKYVPGAPAR
jgi:hypothetical protein